MNCTKDESKLLKILICDFYNNVASFWDAEITQTVQNKCAKKKRKKKD